MHCKLPVFVNAVQNQMDAEQPLDEDHVPSFNEAVNTEQCFPDIRSSPSYASQLARHGSRAWKESSVKGRLCPAPHTSCSRGIGLSLVYLQLAFLISIPGDLGPDDANVTSVSYNLKK